MATGPLVKNTIIEEVKTQLKNMTYTIPVFDKDGKQTGTKEVHPGGPSIEQFGIAVGTALFNILTKQVKIRTEPDQQVQVNTGTGTGSTVTPGTGEIE